MSRLRKWGLLLCVMGLSGCVQIDRFVQRVFPSLVSGSTASANTEEKWCYKTLGSIECYNKPQADSPDRLVNVDPPNRYPQDREAYRKLLSEE